MLFLLAIVLIFSSLYLIMFSSCGPNNLVLAPIVGGVGASNSQLPLFSVGTYKMITTNSRAKPEVSFGYFNYTNKPFAFINLNPINNSLIFINIGSSQFANQGNKVLVLGTAFAAGDNTAGRDIFWVGKILNPTNQSDWVSTINVRGNNYIVIKGTNFIARFNNSVFNSTFDSMTVKKVDNNNDYNLSDFQNIDQDFKSISFIKGGTGYYGVLVGRNSAFSCVDTDSSGNNFRNLYGLSNAPTSNDYVWEDVIPFSKDYQNGLLIGHKISEDPGSAVFRSFNNSAWSSDINGISPFVDPFYSADYITLLRDNSLIKVAFIAGRNSLIGYINTLPNQNQFDFNKLEAVDLSNISNDVTFYGVTVLRDINDINYNVSGIAVGYDFNNNSPIIVKFQRTNNPPNPNPNYPINPNYNLQRVDISNLNLGSDVVLLDVNNVLINNTNTNYVYIVGVDLSNCPIKPYPNGSLPPFTKSLVFPASPPFTTTTTDVINTLNNMRGILLYSNNGGDTFTLLGNPLISP